MAGKREIVADIMKGMKGEMNKGEVKKEHIEKIVVLHMASIKERTDKGERITIRGFGTYLKVWRKPKKGHNPQTGEDIMMPGRWELVLKRRDKN